MAAEANRVLKAAWSEAGHERKHVSTTGNSKRSREIWQRRWVTDRWCETRIQPEDLGYGMRGIKELAVVPVSHEQSHNSAGCWPSIAVVGKPRCAHEVGWKLSQYELGTREASLLDDRGAMLASHANNLSLLEERETCS